MFNVSQVDGAVLPPKQILLAGIAAGAAEVLWVCLYAALTPLSAAEVAREVTASVFGAAIGGGLALVIGVLIHFLLSLAIAGGFAALAWPTLHGRFGSGGVLLGSVALLLAIWTVNFFVVLPSVNERFVELMPLTVTFVSKLLFGVTLGTVLSMEPRSLRAYSELQVLRVRL